MKWFLPKRITSNKNTQSQYPGRIHPGKNETCKITPRQKDFLVHQCLLYNLVHLGWNVKSLTIPGKILNFIPMILPNLSFVPDRVYLGRRWQSVSYLWDKRYELPGLLRQRNLTGKKIWQLFILYYFSEILKKVLVGNFRNLIALQVLN